MQIVPHQNSEIQEVSCPLIPGLVILQTKDGYNFVNAVSAVMALCDQDNNSAKVSWGIFMKGNACMQPKRDILQHSEAYEHVYSYVTKHGNKTVALSISPGLEYLCQNKGGPKANANKEKFLELINTFKQQNAGSSASILGKRPAYRQGYHLPEAPGGPDQSSELSMVHMQAFQVMANGFKSVQVQHHMQVTGELGLIKGEVATVNGGLGLLNGKVAGVETAITNVKGDVINEVKSVHAEVKKGNDDKIKKLEEQLREKDQQLLKKDQLLRAAEAARIQENKKYRDNEQEADKRHKKNASLLYQQIAVLQQEKNSLNERLNNRGTGHEDNLYMSSTDTRMLFDELGRIRSYTGSIKPDCQAIKQKLDSQQNQVSALTAETAAIKAENAAIKTTLKTILDAIMP